MSRRLALLTLTLLVLGCTRYNSRAQGPFNRQPIPTNPTLAQGTLPAGKSALVLNTPAVVLPPAPPDEALPVPPRPPEPAPLGTAFAVPQAPRPPVVKDSSVVPAGGAAPAAGRRPGPGTPNPTAGQPQDTNLAALKKLAQLAAEKWKSIDTYESRLVRRESLDGTAGPTEEVIYQFRKEPMSVYMRNVGEAGKGREVLYNPGQFGDKIHVIVGEGDTRFLKAGSKGPSLSPDSPSVKAKSRHSIRESGFGRPVNGFAGLVAKVEAGKLPPDALKYAGLVRREEYGESPLEGVVQTINRGDAVLPGGGVRHWFFDGNPGSPSYGLPVLVILFDANGRELEYYRFSQLRTPANLTDADFDPARLGKK
ncbi:MAG: hypothetical protein JWO38_5512 [Gemmataceae bacterium]|nr:hypothetical protein [Gemmataceae bacterium]